MYLNILFNFTFLISVVSLLQFALKDSDIQLEWTLFRKILLGILIAGVGAFLMITAIKMESGILFDLRYVAFMVSAIYGGPLVSFIAGTLMFIFRRFVIDYTNSSDIIILTNTILFIWFNIIASLKWTRFNTFLANSAGMITLTVVGSILLRFWSLEYAQFLFFYLLSNLSAAFVIIYFIDYNYEALVQYKHMKVKYEYDYLTSLYNAQSFETKLKDKLEKAKVLEQNLALLMLDLDLFKKVNDTYGHDIGDIVLKEFSQIVTESVRPTDVVARKGGEEFVVILGNCDAETSLRIAERIRVAIEKFVFARSTKPQKITVSIGQAMFPSDASNAKDLVKQSDLALYLAKANGRNRIELYENLKNSRPYVNYTRSGNSTIDKEHAELVKLFSEITSDFIVNTLADSIYDKVCLLKLHFEEHCESEEYQYKKHDVPQNLIDVHHVIHQELISLFNGLLQRLNENDNVLDSEYFSVLSNIIVGHIQTDDSSLFPYLN